LLAVVAALAVFDPDDEVAVAALPSVCGAGALGLHAAKEKLMTARTRAAEYLGMFGFCEIKCAAF
jgi:hypothetical protein